MNKEINEVFDALANYSDDEDMKELVNAVKYLWNEKELYKNKINEIYAYTTTKLIEFRNAKELSKDNINKVHYYKILEDIYKMSVGEEYDKD